MQIDFSNFYQAIAKNSLHRWLNTLPSQLTAWEDNLHADFPKWLKAIKKIDTPAAKFIDLKSQVKIGKKNEISTGSQQRLSFILSALHPWRKGPFSIFDINLDTEWQSNLKWDRLLPHISSLKGRTVLDVGCGNGYHMWRMYGEGANFVTGIDPSDLFLVQFTAIKKIIGQNLPVHLLPLGIEQLPKLKAFDSVFSMGVLYHRRSPIDHLIQLRDQLRVGGELILETLVIDGDENCVLVPSGRYAKMRNVWFLPSAKALKLWLEKCGFENVQIVDKTITSTNEQRATSWMKNQSLDDFLDPNNKNLTIEGHPAPKRAILIATKCCEN